VPVERIFDAGIMDTFIIRVAGNVIDTDEAGSIEYGLAHVNTPVFLVLGHTQCGAVKAVTAATLGHGHPLEINIPPLVDNIGPAVKRAMELNPKAKEDKDIVPAAIVENVWQGVQDLFTRSAAVREMAKGGKVKVVGAIYDVSTGKVEWLPEEKVSTILADVEKDPKRQMQAMADEGKGHEEHGDKKEEHKEEGKKEEKHN
jgi:carbonic anhydrase